MATLHQTARGVELVPSVTPNATGYTLVYALQVDGLVKKDVCHIDAQFEVTSQLPYNVAVSRYLAWSTTQEGLISAPSYIGPCYPACEDDISPSILKDGQDHQVSNLSGAVTGLAGTVFFGVAVYVGTTAPVSAGDVVTVNQDYGGLSVEVA